MGQTTGRTTVVSRGRLSGVLRGERIGARPGALADAAGDRDGVDEAIYYRARLILLVRRDLVIILWPPP